MEQSETPTRELTLEEAVALAILLQKNEQLVEAQELYRVERFGPVSSVVERLVYSYFRDVFHCFAHFHVLPRESLQQPFS